MLEFQRSLPNLVFDEINMTKTLNRVFGQVLREATREWLRVLLSHVPVETGMARATLIPIGEYLNNVGGLIFAPTREPYYSKLEGGLQSIDLGIQKTRFEVIDDAMGSWEYRVYWETDTIHYWQAGYYQPPKKKQGTGSGVAGPKALKEAEDRFFQFFFTTIDRRLPNLGPFIR